MKVHGGKRDRCRHCDHVDDYRLFREHEFRRLESIEFMGSGEKLITFKRWLEMSRGHFGSAYAL